MCTINGITFRAPLCIMLKLAFTGMSAVEYKARHAAIISLATIIFIYTNSIINLK